MQTVYWYDVAEFDVDDAYIDDRIIINNGIQTGTYGEIRYHDPEYDTGELFDIHHGPAPLDWCIKSPYDHCYPIPR